MARFITQRLFDVAAAAGASICENDDEVEHYVQRISEAYQRDFSDHDLAGQWRSAIKAAHEAVRSIELEPRVSAAILQSFAWYVGHFDRDGRKLSIFKRIGGTMFHYESKPVEDMPILFGARFLVYAASAKAGLLRPEWMGPGS